MDQQGTRGGDSASGAAGFDRGAAAATLQREARRSRRARGRADVVAAACWAVAWLIGFLGLWSSHDWGANPWFRLGDGVGRWVFAVMVAGAAVVAVVVGVVSRRGLSGPDTTRATRHGWAWSAAMVAAGLVVVGLGRSGLSDQQRWLVAVTLFTVVAGALLAAGGALGRSVPRFVVGLAFLVLAVVGAWLGFPGLFLLYGVGGGLALVGYAVLLSTAGAEPGHG